MIRPVRAKITAYAGQSPGPESGITFTVAVEEGGGIVTYSGVQSEWSGFWGMGINIDAARCVGWIVPAQLSMPEGRVEVFFIPPPAVAACDPGQPQPGQPMPDDVIREGIPAVSPSETGNIAPESGGIG